MLRAPNKMVRQVWRSIRDFGTSLDMPGAHTIEQVTRLVSNAAGVHKRNSLIRVGALCVVGRETAVDHELRFALAVDAIQVLHKPFADVHLESHVCTVVYAENEVLTLLRIRQVNTHALGRGCREVQRCDSLEFDDAPKRHKPLQASVAARIAHKGQSSAVRRAKKSNKKQKGQHDSILAGDLMHQPWSMPPFIKWVYPSDDMASGEIRRIW